MFRLIMIEFKSNKSELTVGLLYKNEILLSITENDILPRRISLNKKQCNDLINYLSDKRKEMK